MLRFIILLLFLFILPSLYAQKSSQIKPDPRLYECFEASYVNSLQQYQAVKLLYFNYFLDNAYFLVQENHYAHYVFGNTGKVLVFLPASIIRYNFNQYLSDYGFSQN